MGLLFVCFEFGLSGGVLGGQLCIVCLWIMSVERLLYFVWLIM